MQTFDIALNGSYGLVNFHPPLQMGVHRLTNLFGGLQYAAPRNHQRGETSKRCQIAISTIMDGLDQKSQSARQLHDPCSGKLFPPTPPHYVCPICSSTRRVFGLPSWHYVFSRSASPWTGRSQNMCTSHSYWDLPNPKRDNP